MFILEPNGGKKSFSFKCYNAADFHKWITSLNKHIYASEGFTEKKCALTKDPFFWKEQLISEKQMLSQVENCDLMLFRSKKLNNAKRLWKKTYDHVALLLRYSNTEIVLFESSKSY